MNALPHPHPVASITRKRVVGTEAYTFTRTERSLKVEFTWCRSYRDTMEIVPVGAGRYAIVRCGEHAQTVAARDLLPSLKDYQRRAMIALEDRRAA